MGRTVRKHSYAFVIDAILDRGAHKSSVLVDIFPQRLPGPQGLFFSTI